MADSELRNVLRRSCLNSTFWNSYRVLYSDEYGYEMKVCAITICFNCEIVKKFYSITILMAIMKKFKMSVSKPFFY